MQLTQQQLEQFDRDGFLVLPGLFSTREVEVLRRPLARLFAEDDPANIREKAGRVIRTAMALHLRDPTYAKLVRHPRFVDPAMQICGAELYIQQVKVNVKGAFGGDVWQWHYDFATHHGEDGCPNPRALNLHVFLDDVNEFNGPLYFIPGSHKHGALPAILDNKTTSYPLWVVDNDTVAKLVEAGGIVSAIGPVGTGLIFGDCLVHGSPANMSPWRRRIFSLILNPVSNALTCHRRPAHNHHRDLSPVRPLADNCLVV